jgi:hypothetical protein
MPERELIDTGTNKRNLRRVRNDSDALLEQMDRLKELERRKRHLVVSTPAFHELEDEVVDTTRDIFNTVRDEAAASSRIDRQGLTTEDVNPDR